VDGKRNYKGHIKAVGNDGVTISVDAIEVFLSFDLIDRANLIAEV
jgi:ribosome maturation factor RimP